MDQVQTELAEMRANMAQFMTMMQGVVQGQEELRALAQRLEAVTIKEMMARLKLPLKKFAVKRTHVPGSTGLTAPVLWHRKAR